MSNRNINQSGIASPTLAMRANAPVSNTQGRLHDNCVEGMHSGNPILPFALESC